MSDLIDPVAMMFLLIAVLFLIMGVAYGKIIADQHQTPRSRTRLTAPAACRKRHTNNARPETLHENIEQRGQKGSTCQQPINMNYSVSASAAPRLATTHSSPCSDGNLTEGPSLLDKLRSPSAHHRRGGLAFGVDDDREMQRA